MIEIGAMEMPQDFAYKNVFLRGRPRHEKYDSFWRKHPPMDPVKMAKIFSPFDALAGLDEAIVSKRELYSERRELSEGELEELDNKLSQLRALTYNSRVARINAPVISITWFSPCTDPASEWYGRGGQYKETSGICRKICRHPDAIIVDDQSIPLENVIRISLCRQTES